jgi:hypothetical protein
VQDSKQIDGKTIAYIAAFAEQKFDPPKEGNKSE